MEERIAKLKEMLQKSPDDCFLNHALALEYIKNGDEQEAQKLFEHNLSVDVKYIATYYHLGKLLERIGDEEQAVSVYERGMEQCKAQNENHTYSELRSALEELTF
ncbi:MAG: hypothetical protein KDC11_09615 [Chitinophagaceae bacterium]|nr:hypothetical protein [Chitinophagaceae bacterium]